VAQLDFVSPQVSWALGSTAAATVPPVTALLFKTVDGGRPGPRFLSRPRNQDDE